MFTFRHISTHTALRLPIVHQAPGLPRFSLFTDYIVDILSSQNNRSQSGVASVDSSLLRPLRVFENMQLRIRVSHNKDNGGASMSTSNGSSEVREAPSSRSNSLLEVSSPAFERKANARMQLSTYGTSLVANDNDFTGDGDQSPVKDTEAQQMYQDLFRTGGDFYVHLPRSFNNFQLGRSAFRQATVKSDLSAFATHCVLGQHRKVKQILEENSVTHGKPLDALARLLETRETAMHLSPLLMVMAALRTFNAMYSDANHHQRANANANASWLPPLFKNLCPKDQSVELEQNLLQVVMVLLYYGARPDAKDACGKTVCHYGAGIDATTTSMAAVSMCIGAATSAHCFGKEIVLRNMVNDAYNGQGGIAAGYQAETGRRLVYLFGQKTEFKVYNRNILLVEYNENKEKVMIPPVKSVDLVNMRDRMGHTPLSQLIKSPRIDVAQFLLHKHEASIDVPNWDGLTLRGIGATQVATSDVGNLIITEVIKGVHQAQKASENQCVNCRHVSDQALQACRACKSVRFCSDKCQKANWHNGHYKDCQTLRRKYKQYALVTLPTYSNKYPMTTFRRPLDVQPEQKFTIKIQCMLQSDSLLASDHTGHCEFEIGSDQKFYKMLLAKVHEVETTGGAKTYMEAAFDKNGHCKIYLNRSKLRTW